VETEELIKLIDKTKITKENLDIFIKVAILKELITLNKFLKEESEFKIVNIESRVNNIEGEIIGGLK
jgi:hypothetical protein